MRNLNKRVVVTGLGAITPLGESVSEFWNGLVSGTSGVGPMTLADPSAYSCKISGEVSNFDPEKYIDKREARRMSRFSQLAISASSEALNAAGISYEKIDRTRMGVILGNGNGGYPDIEAAVRQIARGEGTRLSPFYFPMTLPNMAAANVSRLFGAEGVCSTVTTACAASTHAIGDAMTAIRNGIADVVITGGAEAGISELGLAGFCAMRALTSRNDQPETASRPFDLERDGFIPSEGAGILILEEMEHAISRGADIIVELIGSGSSSDAFHQFQPDSTGAGAARAISLAINDAGIQPDEIDYINAHGTSTPLNDAIETNAIKSALGGSANSVPISSTKSMIGHALGASGGMEAVACVKTIETGIIHPTINYSNPDPDCGLDYVPNIARDLPVSTVLSNSFGFGGQNSCVIFRAFEQ